MRTLVFIGIDKTKRDKVTTLVNAYGNAFRSIIDSLYNEGKIKDRYSPYNARDTFIENAWQGVEDGVISHLDITSVTGNSARTAVKHYRNRDNIKRYIEAVYEIYVPE